MKFLVGILVVMLVIAILKTCEHISSIACARKYPIKLAEKVFNIGLYTSVIVIMLTESKGASVVVLSLGIAAGAVAYKRALDKW